MLAWGVRSLTMNCSSQRRRRMSTCRCDDATMRQCEVACEACEACEGVVESWTCFGWDGMAGSRESEQVESDHWRQLDRGSEWTCSARCRYQRGSERGFLCKKGLTDSSCMGKIKGEKMVRGNRKESKRRIVRLYSGGDAETKKNHDNECEGDGIPMRTRVQHSASRLSEILLRPYG